MFEGFLKTRLFPPPPRSTQVKRKALMEKFVLARQRGIVCSMVSAPPGFGKTTLVVDYARSSGLPFAWLALDEGDNDLPRFWHNIYTALVAVDSHIGKEIRSDLYESQTPDIQKIITGLVNNIFGIEKELILVLDDYHLITNQAIHEGMIFLINHLPPFFHLIIVTRTDPPWPLARLRAIGEMTESRIDDLRFSAAEIAAFLNLGFT